MPYPSDVYMERRFGDIERRFNEMNERITRVELTGEKRIEQLSNKIEQMTTSLGMMQTAIERTSTTRWQWIAGTSISFFIGGGGLYGLMSLAHVLK